MRAQSKLIGGALFLVYRWSLGRLVARILRDAPHAERDEERALPDDCADPETLGTIYDAAKVSERWIGEVREYLTTIGSTVRRVVVLPLVALVGGVATLATLPLIAIWWLV